MNVLLLFSTTWNFVEKSSPESLHSYKNSFSGRRWNLKRNIFQKKKLKPTISILSSSLKSIISFESILGITCSIHKISEMATFLPNITQRKKNGRRPVNGCLVIAEVSMTQNFSKINNSTSKITSSIKTATLLKTSAIGKNISMYRWKLFPSCICITKIKLSLFDASRFWIRIENYNVDTNCAFYIFEAEWVLMWVNLFTAHYAVYTIIHTWLRLGL